MFKMFHVHKNVRDQKSIIKTKQFSHVIFLFAHEIHALCKVLNIRNCSSKYITYIRAPPAMIF